jgi:hypothetical protein
VCPQCVRLARSAGPFRRIRPSACDGRFLRWRAVNVSQLEVTHRGRSAVVFERTIGIPSTICGSTSRARTFFLGVLVPGMTRRDVRRMGQAFLERETPGTAT